MINAVIPDPNIFLWIAASLAAAAAAAAAVNPNGIKTLLATVLSKFLIKDNSVFSNGLKSLPKNLPDCPILCNWVFDNFILPEELLAGLQELLKIYKASKLVY